MLTMDDVHLIRTSPLSTAKLAEAFGLEPCTIRRARHGQTFVDHPTSPRKLKRGGWKKPQPAASFNPETFSLPGEEWRPAVGWEQHYRVSNYGRVYSLHQTGRLTVGMQVAGGYRVIKLRSEGRKAHKAVHCLVLEAFRGPRPGPHYEGCHNDGYPPNSRLENLRWDTAANNQADRKKHGRHNGGRPAKRVSDNGNESQK